MENYIYKDGKKYELTEEQWKKLGIKENLFDVKNGENAYWVDGWFDTAQDKLWSDDEIKYHTPCKDKELVKKRAKAERLSRLLWKFANENEDEPTEGDWKNYALPKYYIYYNYDSNAYQFTFNKGCEDTGKQYFKTELICRRAIKEVIEPFMKGEIE